MAPFAEVAIVGAGPAGARAAELLSSRGASVVLLDPRVPWEKPCGGGLTWSAFAEIPELSEIQGCAREIRAMRIELGPQRGFLIPLDRSMWIIPRETLGRWQLERSLAAGAEHVAAKVRSVDRCSGGWVLETDEGRIECAVLVGADGAASAVRPVVAPGFRVELAPTRVAYPGNGRSEADTVLVQFYESIAGYLWDFPRPRHRSVGIGVPNGTWRRATFDAEIDAYRNSTGTCGCPPPPRAGAVIGTAQLGHGDFGAVGGSDFALLGDAAGFADPLTGEGIFNAMRSATFLAEAWAVGRLVSYPQLVRRAFGREFAVSRALRRYVLERPLGLRWIEAALRRAMPYAGLAALFNAVNEHDWRATALLGRTVTCWRHTRSHPESAERGERDPVPCRCKDA